MALTRLTCKAQATDLCSPAPHFSLTALATRPPRISTPSTPSARPQTQGQAFGELAAGQEEMTTEQGPGPEQAAKANSGQANVAAGAPAQATHGADRPMLAAEKKAADKPEADEALNWERWRVSPQADRGDGWAYAVCPRCHAQDNEDAYPTAMANLASGKFFCAQCGLHGDARLSPSQYRQARVDLSQPWWEPQEIEQLQAWLVEQLPADLPVDMEVGLDRVLTTVDDRLSWEAGLILSCRAKADGPISSLIFLPVLEDGTFLPVQDLPGTDSIPWGWDKVSGSEVVFVSHPFDRIALMMAGVPNVVCTPPRMNPLLPGGGDWSALGNIEKDLLGMNRVVMAMRDDESGRKLEEELARRVGKDRCFRVRWAHYAVENGTTGAQTVLIEHGPEQLAEAVEKAPAFPVAGVHELYEVEDQFELLYEFGLQPGVSTGWPSLDLRYTVKLGQWTVVTGIPGHGKSTLVDALAVNLAQLHGWKFGIFSPENQPIERHYASLMEKAAGQPFSEGAHPRISKEVKNELKGWLNDHFKAILPDEDDDGNWSIDHILALGRTLVYRHGIKGLIIDPWSELTHLRPPHMTQAEYIGLELTKVRRFARTYGVHVWVVTHPTKLEKGPDSKYSVVTPYMLEGGANWRNKADNILSGFRNLMQPDGDILDIYVQKIRFKEVGSLGRASLRGDPTCGRLIDDIDQQKREAALRSPTPVPTSQLRTTERKFQPQGMPIRNAPNALTTSHP